MQNFTKNDIISGRFYDFYIDGDLYAQIISNTSTSEADQEDVIINGSSGKEKRTTGWSGSGSFVLYQTYDGFEEKVQEKINNDEDFVFDIASSANDPVAKGSKRTVIEDCTITKFNPLEFDQAKLGQKTFEYTYNPKKVRYE